MKYCCTGVLGSLQWRYQDVSLADDVWDWSTTSCTSTKDRDAASETGRQLTWTTPYVATQRRVRRTTFSRTSLRLWASAVALRHSPTGGEIHRHHDRTTCDSRTSPTSADTGVTLSSWDWHKPSLTTQSSVSRFKLGIFKANDF